MAWYTRSFSSIARAARWRLFWMARSLTSLRASARSRWRLCFSKIKLRWWILLEPYLGTFAALVVLLDVFLPKFRQFMSSK